MTISKTENKSWIGIIVGGGTDDPDPQKMGRVRVAVPQLMSPGISVSDLPWCQLGSSATHDGAWSFNRPPQNGTFVRISYPQGSKSSGKGLVTHIYNQSLDPKDIPGNTTLFDKGWIAKALSYVPKVYGFPDITQTSETNDTGAEKITLSNLNDSRYVSSLSNRLRIPSNIAGLKSFYNPYDVIKNVATSMQEDSEAMKPELANSIPGLDFLTKNLKTYITSEALSKLSPEISSSLDSILSILGSSSPKSGTNFVQQGTRINGDVFGKNISNAISSIRSLEELDNLLSNLGNIELTGLDLLESFISKLPGPFGEISQSIDAHGNISNSINDITKQLFDQMVGSTANVPSVIGGLLSKSSIVSDTHKRLSVAKQREFLDSVTTNISTNVGGILSKVSSFLGGS